MAEPRRYLCSSCSTEFTLDPAEPKRCPSCMRASGLVEHHDAPARSAAGRTPLIAAVVVVVLAGAGVAAWFALRSEPATEPGTTPPGLAAAREATDPLTQVPEELRSSADEPTGAVQLVAQRLSADPDALVRAVAAARESGALPVRPDDDGFFGAPRSAADLAPALDGKAAPTSGTLELALLARAMLAARDLGPVTYGVDDSGPGAATDLARRRYLVRVEGGEWLAPDGKPVDASAVRPLDPAGVLANELAWRALGAVESGELELAAKASQQARALAPDDAAIAFATGRVQVAGGLGEMGLSAMESAAAKRSDGRTWFVLATVALGADQPFKAHQYLTRAVEADPTMVDAYVLMAQLALERLEVTPEEQRPTLIEQIQKHVADARAQDPNARGVRIIEAQLAAIADDLPKAEQLLVEETRLHPDDAQAWLVLAQFLASSGRASEAVEKLQQAADSGVAGPEVQEALGAMLANEGRLSEAAKALERALEMEPGNQHLRPQLAQLDKELGDMDRARALLQEQLRLVPGDAQAPLLLAQLEMDAGDFAAAEKALATALIARPDDPDALVLRYLVAIRTHKGEEAARDKALAALGKRSALAQHLLEQGFFPEGEVLLREAIKEEPSDGLAPVLLTVVLVATGRAEEAAAVRADALARAEDDEARKALSEQFDAAERQALEVRKALAGAAAGGEAPGEGEAPSAGEQAPAAPADAAPSAAAPDEAPAPAEPSP
ncbi:MAG: tetratricopeptide repeat protein [Deltaproteobacteria bacterium]|nr:tetratricopeptide repeat protein [Deltaproteobacteria bacterium]MCB9785499.1 tetratricopeptide repeat protein [Deltaproteobacteria bacterium]